LVGAEEVVVGMRLLQEQVLEVVVLVEGPLALSVYMPPLILGLLSLTQWVPGGLQARLGPVQAAVMVVRVARPVLEATPLQPFSTGTAVEARRGQTAYLVRLVVGVQV
jgi:hypothetical protein